MIISLATITTAFTLFIFYGMFFFFGFFNPIIFGGTAPLLLLKLCVQKEKKRHVTVYWIAISLFLVIVTSIIIFVVGSPMFSGGFRF